MGEINFITIKDMAEERECNPRTILEWIQKGILPPLPGNQSGMRYNKRGWPKVYLDTWLKARARQDAKLAAAAT